ncbi:MAG: STAS domain-containing protein [Acidimicrobiales bacterium]
MTELPARLDIEVIEPRRLALHGDLDAHTASVLETELDQLGTSSPVHLMMAGVTFMDSTGIRGVVSAHGRHAEAGSCLLLVDPSDAVLRILEITGLTDVLTLER